MNIDLAWWHTGRRGWNKDTRKLYKLGCWSMGDFEFFVVCESNRQCQYCYWPCIGTSLSVSILRDEKDKGDLLWMNFLTWDEFYEVMGFGLMVLMGLFYYWLLSIKKFLWDNAFCFCVSWKFSVFVLDKIVWSIHID